MTDTTTTPTRRRIWRTPHGRRIFAHAVWVGSWFAATPGHMRSAARCIVLYPEIKQFGAS